MCICCSFHIAYPSTVYFRGYFSIVCLSTVFNALHVPSYQQNILSVSAEVDNGSKVNLGPQVSTYTTEEGSKFEIKRKGRLYYLNSISSSANNARTIQEWHRILGHCNYGDGRKLEKVVKGMKITDHRETDCEVCTEGKMCEFRNPNSEGTQELGLTFKKSVSPLSFEGFCDSGWGASTVDRRSITGYNFQLSSTEPLISWKSRKQQTVAWSTCEAEYVALANAVQEAKFLNQLCKDMKVSIKQGKSLIRIDNQGAMNLAKNPVHHQRTKHIDIKYHFIRLEIQEGRINVEYVPTKQNMAGVFTKAASKNKLEDIRASMLDG